MAFGRALTILSSHEEWVQATLLGIELGTLEVKASGLTNYTTEAPIDCSEVSIELLFFIPEQLGLQASSNTQKRTFV